MLQQYINKCGIVIKQNHNYEKKAYSVMIKKIPLISIKQTITFHLNFFFFHISINLIFDKFLKHKPTKKELNF